MGEVTKVVMCLYLQTCKHKKCQGVSPSLSAIYFSVMSFHTTYILYHVLFRPLAS